MEKGRGDKMILPLGLKRLPIFTHYPSMVSFDYQQGRDLYSYNGFGASDFAIPFGQTGTRSDKRVCVNPRVSAADFIF